MPSPEMIAEACRLALPHTPGYIERHARTVTRYGHQSLSAVLAARGWRHEAGPVNGQRVYDADGALVGDLDALQCWALLMLMDDEEAGNA
jgi:hypothetical protein